ncbi:HD domain-containing protein [Corynebacterium sp. L4756]|uniref:HD domain-containing protein n=1 Tax=unclassified Corynebacterium TaxID=2624378 RepID=UPI00374D1855
MSQRLLRAINVAAWAHDGQLRKGTDIPYVSHVYGVMHLVSQQPGVEEDTQIAALLHDVLEDVPQRYSATDMTRDFGSNVTEIVQALTKDKSLPAWQERADDYLARLQGAPRAVVIIAACDKVHNLSSILADYELVGEQLWDRFNSGKQAQNWWYHAVYEALVTRLQDLGVDAHGEDFLPVLVEYRALLKRLDAAIGG